MSKEHSFLIYCIEIYKNAKQSNGKDVISLFDRYGVVEYILTFFESLHTTGEQYIVADIDAFIAVRE